MNNTILSRNGKQWTTEEDQVVLDCLYQVNVINNRLADINDINKLVPVLERGPNAIQRRFTRFGLAATGSWWNSSIKERGVCRATEEVNVFRRKLRDDGRFIITDDGKDLGFKQINWLVGSAWGDPQAPRRNKGATPIRWGMTFKLEGKINEIDRVKRMLKHHKSQRDVIYRYVNLIRAERGKSPLKENGFNRQWNGYIQGAKPYTNGINRQFVKDIAEVTYTNLR